MVYALDNDIWLPEPDIAEEDGLLAIGGDLSIERLLLGYQNSIFPWYNEGDPIMWWSPSMRYILRPAQIHISHSMRKFFRKNNVTMEIGRDFEFAMHRCRTKREGETWITDEMEKAYYNLHNVGYATDVQVFYDGQLAGGLYGVVIDKCFFGESMFTEIDNGSKCALIMLAKLLEKMEFYMIDCQFHTDHLESMGGEYMTRDEYCRALKLYALSFEKVDLDGRYCINSEWDVQKF